MKTLTVSYSDSSGGAARAAYRLHRALNRKTKSNQMLVNDKKTSDYSVLINERRMSRYFDSAIKLLSHVLQRLQKTSSKSLHSFNVFGSSLYGRIESNDANIVNIHWVNFEALSISQIAKINKPIVMTLHDMWAFNGSEHLCIDSDSSAFKVGYDNSKPNSDYISGLNLNKWTWERKKKNWVTPFPLVCPSNWLANCVRDSRLFSGWDVHVIPNCLDTTVYKPLGQAISRNIFNISSSAVVVGFGAYGEAVDPNKGFDLLQSTLNILVKENPDTEFIGLIFGRDEPERPLDLAIPCYFTGHLSDDTSLAVVYNAMDVMVVPSKQEAFGQTASEAQSCGVPVVAFETTGLQDVVSHRETGFLAKPFDTADLARGIQWCMGEDVNSKLGEAARQRALTNWSEEVVAKQYNYLYEQYINKSDKRAETR